MHKNLTQNDYSRYAANRDVISLFCGAMGLDIGLGKAGLNVVIGQDFDAACVKTMKANGHKVLGGDIREIQPQQLLDMTGLAVGEPFLAIAFLSQLLLLQVAEIRLWQKELIL